MFSHHKRVEKNSAGQKYSTLSSHKDFAEKKNPEYSGTTSELN